MKYQFNITFDIPKYFEGAIYKNVFLYLKTSSGYRFYFKGAKTVYQISKNLAVTDEAKISKATKAIY
jgi:hypothetical protein